MPSDFDELAAQLPALGARPLADLTLEWVLRRHAASGASVLEIRSDGETVPFITRDVPTGRLMRAQRLAKDHASLLAAGQEITGPDFLLVPLMNGTGQLLGMLFLDSPKIIGTSGFMDTYAVVFANCLSSRSINPSPALAAFLGTLTPRDDDRDRERLLLSLNRHEWNVSRVAREIGVTRRTIYLWLQKWGIERRRIQKGPARPASPPMA